MVIKYQKLYFNVYKDDILVIANTSNLLMRYELGQFYTTNFQYILQNMYIPSDITKIIEPFVGNGDLLSFIPDKSNYEIEISDSEWAMTRTLAAAKAQF